VNRTKGSATILHPDGTEGKLDSKPSLQVAQATVGGYVQMVNLADGRQLLFDEDGLTKHRSNPAKYPTNVKATALAIQAGAAVDPHVGAVGTALLLAGSFRWS
jgi:hypothetical protein